MATKYIKNLIESLVEEEFEKAPKMGDLDPTEEPDSERPGMKGRPKSGMDISQHHKMLHAESWEKITHSDKDDIEDLLTIVRQRVNFGQSLDEIIAELGKDFEIEDVVLAYRASKLLNKYEDEEDVKPLEESTMLTGFDFFDMEDNEEEQKIDPSFEAFKNLKRGNVVKIGKTLFDITNNMDNFTKVANVHGSKGRKYWILRFDPDTKMVSVYQGQGGTMDHGSEPKVVGAMTLVEVSAVSAGAASLAPAGQITGSGPNAFVGKEELKKIHKKMWSNTKKPNRR